LIIFASMHLSHCCTIFFLRLSSCSEALALWSPALRPSSLVAPPPSPWQRGEQASSVAPTTALRSTAASASPDLCGPSTLPSPLHAATTATVVPLPSPYHRRTATEMEAGGQRRADATWNPRVKCYPHESQVLELEWTLGIKYSSNYSTWIIHPNYTTQHYFYNYRFTILPLII
jgi:hypothetical protein